MFRRPKLLKKYEALRSMKTTDKDIVNQQTKKRVQPTDAKVDDPLTNTTSGSDQREIIILNETDMTKKFKPPSRVEWSTYEIIDTPHFVIYEATMTTDADDSIAESDSTKEHPPFAVDESAEVPELVPALILQDSLDLTYVTDLSDSVLSGCESDVSELLVLNSTHEELDIDDSRPTRGLQYDDQLWCPFSCCSPASFNLRPVPSFYAESCLESTDVERSTSQLSCFSDELDSFFDLSLLQNEQYSPYVQRTAV